LTVRASVKERREVMKSSSWLLALSLVALAGCTGCPEQKPGVPPPPLPQAPSPVPPPPAAPAEEPKQPPPSDPRDEFEVRLERLANRPLGDGVLESVLKQDKHLRVYAKEKRIEIDGFTCLKRGPYLELLACTPHGKTHESLLIWCCDPEKLHLALILLGLKPSQGQVKEFGEEKTLAGDKVTIEVEWAKDAKAVPGPGIAGERHFVEELIFDQKRNGPMPRAGWVFTGSTTIDEFVPPDYKEAKKVYAATATGTVAVTFHDPAALLDTSLEGSQTTYIPWNDRLPERFTPIVVHLRPWREGDEKEEAFDPKKVVKPEGGGAPGGPR
jgi:hypothetical protein